MYEIVVGKDVKMSPSLRNSVANKCKSPRLMRSPKSFIGEFVEGKISWNLMVSMYIVTKLPFQITFLRYIPMSGTMNTLEIPLHQ